MKRDYELDTTIWGAVSIGERISVEGIGERDKPYSERAINMFGDVYGGGVG